MKFDHDVYRINFLEIFSSQFDLDPSTIDNIDPREVEAKRLSFIKDKLEDVLSGNGSGMEVNDVVITKEMLEESFSMSFSQIKRLANPEKMVEKIQKKLLPVFNKLLGSVKVKNIIKNTKDDVEVMIHEFGKIRNSGSKQEQKSRMMVIAKKYISKKYNLSDEEGSKSKLLLDITLFFIFAALAIKTKQMGRDGLAMVDSLLAFWCLVDVVKGIISLISNKNKTQLSVG